LTTALTLMALGLSMNALAFTPDLTEVDGRSVPIVKWDTTLEKFGFHKDKFIGQRFTAHCPKAPRKMKTTEVDKAVIYPSDSSICMAGLRAGRIDNNGGQVTVQLNPGGAVHARSATGNTRNISVIQVPGTDAINKVYLENIPEVDWNAKFTRTGFAYKHLVGQRFTFDCPSAPSNLRPRRVVGTDSYAFDSVICRAAVHAGTITKDGGMVTVQMNPAIKQLTGSVRNGIESKKGTSGLNALSFVDNPVNP
ncbi:MAG: LCCL domain-containing protein, partial [Nitrospirales bacterium]